MLRVEDAFEPSNSGLILGYDENKCCELNLEEYSKSKVFLHLYFLLHVWYLQSASK
jgi:hypothetical protein